MEARLEKDSLWITQKQIADLFATERSVITKHLRNIFNTKELIKNSVSAIYAHTKEKAAHLLYFLVKNHSFVDGNKRIAAVIFLQFLEKNNLLYRKDGSQLIANNALVAITLMIAESNPEEKNIITTMITNLINKKN